MGSIHPRSHPVLDAILAALDVGSREEYQALEADLRRRRRCSNERKLFTTVRSSTGTASWCSA